MLSILKRQFPYVINGTITGIVITYYYEFFINIIVNSIIWFVITYVINKYYYKSKGFEDHKYIIQYALSKIK